MRDAACGFAAMCSLSSGGAGWSAPARGPAGTAAADVRGRSGRWIVTMGERSIECVDPHGLQGPRAVPRWRIGEERPGLGVRHCPVWLAMPAQVGGIDGRVGRN